jgi:radical SAM protein with 4Fe4S-binding SPASM domain
MDKQNKVLSVNDFLRILNRFSDFTIGELTLNIINEPFTDKTIIEKLEVLAGIKQKIEVIFFSSNWLIPDELALDAFACSIKKCANNPNIGKIHLNATVSGIDKRTYDIQQAGVDLVDAVAPYRELDFNKAVRNVRGVMERISGIIGVEKIKFRIKAYGNAFTEDEMKSFWLHELDSSSIPVNFVSRHVKIMLNHGYTTFARSFNEPSSALFGRCSRHWLDRRLVVGPQGEIGLCCEDGLNSVVIGNILDQELAELVANKSFQINLAKVTGRYQANLGDPCHRCSFFEIAQ